jgi:hypothetical protein
MPNLNAGAGAEVAETTQVKRPSSARMEQVKFGEDERVFFRVATPDIFTADTHRFTPVLTQAPAEMVEKAKKDKRDVKWPSVMWAVCQDDRIFNITDEAGEPVRDSYEAGYGNCRIKHYFAGKKGKYDRDLTKVDRLTYVVVVLQEATFDTSGTTSKLKALKDKTEKWTDKDGAEVTVPAIRYMAQFYRNVYSPMINSVNLGDGRLVGKSFMVKRSGKDYTVAVVPGIDASDDELATYTRTLDTMGFTLGDFILQHAGTEHYDRFWGDGSGTPAPDAGGNGNGAVQEPDAAPGVPLDPAAQLNLNAFEAALGKNAAKAGSEPAEVSS